GKRNGTAPLPRRLAQLPRSDVGIATGATGNRGRRRLAEPTTGNGRNLMSNRLASALLVVFAMAMPAHAATHAITPDDIVDLRQVSDPQITADGKRIAYVVATPQREGKPARRRIWRIDAHGQAKAIELQAPADANDNTPRW